MANSRWSYSRFSTFNSCQNKYYLQYIKELVVIGKEIEVQDKGLSVHQIAEQMNSKLSFEELMEIAKKDLGERSFDQEKFPVIKAIPRLYEWWQEFIVPYEQKGFELKKESWERGIIANQPIVGALDTLLINEKSKDIRIYDFKTAKTPNASTYQKQLILYAYLIGKRLNIDNISDKVKIFVFFPLANIIEEEVSNKEIAKKQAMKMMKQIIYTDEDIINIILEFEDIIKKDLTIDWNNINPMEIAQLSYGCSWCNFAGNKQYCPLSYNSGLRFSRKAKVLTKQEKEEYDKKC
jgi:hypothetical protein